MKLKKALLIIDVQNDFCKGGALEVPDGDKVVPVLNQYISTFSEKKLPIIATRDWHPGNSKHFKKFGGQWPVHCVQNTGGAEFRPDLQLPKKAIVISGGVDPAEDGYSAFESTDSGGTRFSELMKKLGVDELFIGGLATDYCVKASVLDALKSGFKVKLLIDAIKGVNLKPTDSEEAIEEMVKNGAEKIILGDLDNETKDTK